MKQSNEDKLYLLGQSVGLEEAANFLLERASILFKDRQDDSANLLRNLANELQLMSDSRYEHPKETESEVKNV